MRQRIVNTAYMATMLLQCVGVLFIGGCLLGAYGSDGNLKKQDTVFFTEMCCISIGVILLMWLIQYFIKRKFKITI